MKRWIKQKLSIELGFRLVWPRPNDAYIISYPRSGTTWVRTMLTNLMRPEDGSDPDVFNAVIPGVSIRNSLRIGRLASPRLLASHTCYRDKIRRAIYIVRDGRDVLVSYFHYLTTREVEVNSFEQFLSEYCRGRYGQRWDSNVESWLVDGRRALGERLRIVRFEDLKADPEKGLRQIADFVNLPATNAALRQAVEASSLDHMRQIERSRRGAFTEDSAFYRKGSTGQWKEYLTGELGREFMNKSSTALRLAGYTTSSAEPG